LQKAEEALDLPFGLGIAGVVGEQVHVQFQEDPMDFGGDQALQGLLAVDVEAALLVAGDPKLGVVVGVEHLGPAIPLHGLPQHQQVVVAGVGEEEPAGHDGTRVVIQDGHHVHPPLSRQPRPRGGIHLPEDPEGPHLEALGRPPLPRYPASGFLPQPAVEGGTMDHPPPSGAASPSARAGADQWG
jgi:hypothetical protein